MSSISFSRIPALLSLTVVCLPNAARPAETTPRRYLVTSLAPGQPSRINDAGEIAGRVNVTYGTITTQHAAIRRNGVWLDLGVLEDDTASLGVGINSFGVVVGGSSKPQTVYEGRYRAIQAGNTPIQAVPGLVGEDSFAYAINNAGQICGVKGPLTPDSNKPWHAFIADGSSVTDLHSAVEGALGESRSETSAADINASGDVVGQAMKSFTPTRGFVYRGGVVTILAGADGSGGTWSLYAPAAISDSGLVAGVAFLSTPSNPQTQSRAVLYDTRAGTMTPLPGPPGGQPIVRSEAYDIDAAGRVVGQALVEVSPSASRYLAFLYENGTTVDLNTLIPAGSGWELESAFAINNVGQIVGSGKFGGQYGHYFLLTPANEPPTVTLEGPPSVDEGSSLTLTATATDPDGGTLVYEWDLDGEVGYEVADAGSSVELGPAGDDGPATRTVGVRVTDEGGLKATAAVTVEILNRAPTATLSASATTVYVNAAVGLALTNPFDPSATDTAAGFSYAWDCTNDGVFEADGAATHDCVYSVGGGQTARVRIADKDGSFSDYEVALNVRTGQQGIADLIQTVIRFGLSGGMENSFVTKLEHALDSLEAGHLALAGGDLRGFISHAQAQSGKALTTEQASQIIGEAERICAALGCS